MSVARILDVLGDPTRRQIIAFLALQEARVSDIAGEFTISQPAISQHLRVLRQAGLVRVRPQAQQRFYSVDAAELARAGVWMLRMAGYGDRLDSLPPELV
jgi:DNA-binding transcriptional ArsR family regulator